jgi:hypothetical protein
VVIAQRAAVLSLTDLSLTAFVEDSVDEVDAISALRVLNRGDAGVQVRGANLVVTGGLGPLGIPICPHGDFALVTVRVLLALADLLAAGVPVARSFHGAISGGGLGEVSAARTKDDRGEKSSNEVFQVGLPFKLHTLSFI